MEELNYENLYFRSEYNYDSVGNLLSQNENGITTSYGYDSLYRLTGVSGNEYRPGGNSYGYDSIGNRLKYEYKDGIIQLKIVDLKLKI